MQTIYGETPSLHMHEESNAKIFSRRPSRFDSTAGEEARH
jgi:hypothetical protein